MADHFVQPISGHPHPGSRTTAANPKLPSFLAAKHKRSVSYREKRKKINKTPVLGSSLSLLRWKREEAGDQRDGEVDQASGSSTSAQIQEEKRQLSEGGGSICHEEAPPAAEQVEKQKVDIMDLPTEEIDEAYHYVFKFEDEIYTPKLLREQELLEDIQKSYDKKFLDDKTSALKKAITSPGSDNVKKIKSAIRSSQDILDRIGQMQRELSTIKLDQTAAQAKYKECTHIINQDVTGKGDDQLLILGFLGHVWRLEH
ncbi:hypothetical protein ACP4OV_030121 [Aristida adscensionis]